MVTDAEDVEELRELIQKHADATQSAVAADVLDRWDETLSEFVKVMPIDYKNALEQRKKKVSNAAALAATN